MILKGTNIEIPDSLVVDGNLNLHGTNVTTLPNGLTIGGDLYLEKSKIITLSNGLKIGGSLYLRDTMIEALVNGLTICGSLYLCDTMITTLPHRLSVGRFLDLRHSKIKHIHNDLKAKTILAFDKQLTASEEKQIELIKQNKSMIQIFKEPTEKTTRLHQLLWEL